MAYRASLDLEDGETMKSLELGKRTEGMLGTGEGAILERKRLGGMDKKGNSERGQAEKGLGQVRTWRRVDRVWEDIMVVVEHGGCKKTQVEEKKTQRLRLRGGRDRWVGLLGC